MSTPALLLAENDVNIPFTYVAIAAAASVGVWAMFGVFVPKKIEGPPRITGQETPARIFGIIGIGLMVWVLAVKALSQTIPGAMPVHASDTPTPGQVVLNVAAESAGLLAMLAANVVFRTRGLALLGLDLKRLVFGIPLGAMNLVLIFAPILCVMSATESLWAILHRQHPAAHQLLEMLQRNSSHGVIVLVIISASVIAPLAEETFFRGHLQTALRTMTKRPWIALIVTSLLFASLHPWWEAPPILVLGLCLGYVYERTGNLWTSIVMHSLFNSVMVAAYLWQLLGGG